MDDGHLPFLCLQYHDSAGVKHLVPAVYLGDVDSMDGSKLKDMVVKNDSFAPKVTSKGKSHDVASQLSTKHLTMWFLVPVTPGIFSSRGVLRQCIELAFPMLL